MHLIDALVIIALHYPLLEIDAKDCAAEFDKNSVCSPSSELIKKEFNLKYEEIELDRKHKNILSQSLLNTSITKELVLNKAYLYLSE